ncbi:MAG: hypothetical protein K2P88_15725 [Chitinophagaceae bacterium]|nr:hypothetical protein [Chitinophagaceae bacterium]
MKTELFKVIKKIDEKKLTNDDLEELLRFFMVTKNDLTRNQIAFIFADLHYNKAVPYIIKKINEKGLFHNNGSLVYSLGSFDMKKYFIELIKIICTHAYEPRLMAYDIVHDFAPSIPNRVKIKALKILEEQRIQLEQIATDKGENSTLHFIEKTKELLQSLTTASPLTATKKRIKM